MRITELDYCQVADMLIVSEELASFDQGCSRVHTLQHPELGDILVIANAGANAGFLIQDSAQGESTHAYLRGIATCKF